MGKSGRIIRLIRLLLLLLSMGGFMPVAAEDPDSVKKKTEPRSHWRLTLRAHSKAIFNFGGRMGSDNPATDINFTYDRKKWGFLFFKGQDIYDHTTYYNFALVTVYKNFKLSPHLTMTPSIGTFLEQANSVADKGSDAVFILTTAYRLNHNIILEQMSLFGNLIIEPGERDWVNRFRILYTGKHLDLIGSLWHNNQVFDASSYWSCGLSAGWGRMKLSEHLLASIGIAGLVTLQTSDPSVNPNKNVFQVTFSLQAFR